MWPTGADISSTDGYQYDNGFDWVEYNEQIGSFAQPVLADIDGRNPMQQWYRHVMPLELLPAYKGKTYAEIKELGIDNFRLQSINQGSAQPGHIDVCVDNVRIYYKKK